MFLCPVSRGLPDANVPGQTILLFYVFFDLSSGYLCLVMWVTFLQKRLESYESVIARSLVDAVFDPLQIGLDQLVAHWVVKHLHWYPPIQKRTGTAKPFFDKPSATEHS